MRGRLLIGGTLLGLSLAGLVQAESSRRSLQGSTEQAADAQGWNGRLPDGADPRALTGAGSRLGLDADYGAGNAYGSYGTRYGFDPGPCGWNDGRVLRGGGHTAGSLDGGSFRSTVRCADGYPGLPLRQRPAPAPIQLWDQAPYLGYDDAPYRR
ncbi:hypothetical protein [uncultured Nevskia sp.]|uniref:hypothetical protein n=1 Tax=uncultured Nevskia sp. TaxID=228950 RepID=UPI0025F54039|nr:hypothetical protein [uncultured Nevskia sp.]